MPDERSILLVEDEGQLRTILARNLERRGYRVIAAATGADALAALRAGLPALLLLDVNLPDMTGWDVLRALPPEMRQRIPTIVVSAVAQHPKRLHEFGDVAFLHKPFPLDTLLRLVADQLSADRANIAGEVRS
jgi:two-component system nitrogen regulation response regulator GlnG